MTSSSKKCQIALDLGTTTLTGRLLSLTGELLSEMQRVNPQRELGADILLRLQQAHAGEGKALQALLVKGVRSLIGELLARAERSPGDIVSAVAAGNPGVSSLLCHLPVAALISPPHKPPYKNLLTLSPATIDFGLKVSLELFPLISGFVGGDLVACLFALEEVVPGTLLIDIGTNAELALWDGVRWWVTSAAAGPAFEGGNINVGMILEQGAVTDVELQGDRLQLTVAGGGEPRGLCGSGLAALVAVARQGDLIDGSGRICAAAEVETNLARYLVKKDDAWTLCFYRNASRELFLTQADLRNFQLAKGAVQAGALTLLEKAGFTPENVREVLLTGALGTALRKDVLKRVALLPEPMLDKTRLVTNGVLAGLQRYLLAEEAVQQLESLVTVMQPLPLSGTPAFARLFLGALEF